LYNSTIIIIIIIIIIITDLCNCKIECGTKLLAKWKRSRLCTSKVSF